jgi:hypothetical protein
MKTSFNLLLFVVLSSQPFASISERISDFEKRLEAFEKRLNPNQEDEISPSTKAAPSSLSTNKQEGATQLPTVDLPVFSEDPKKPELESKKLVSKQRTKLIQSTFPVVEELAGQITRFNSDTRSFVLVLPGYEIKERTLFVVGSSCELIVSFPGRIAARISENSRIVVGPEVEGGYEVELRNGTVSALLDPDRDPSRDPRFAIRTLSGVTEAVGTYYAVTEYKGQSYTSVKRGQIKKKTSPPTEPDFSSYLIKKKKPSPPSKK